MSADPIIRLENVHKAFGEKRVLQGVNLDLPRGKSVVIIGGSGTGKSVTLKCILGLLRPDSGRIFVDGVETSTLGKNEWTPVMDKIGMLFQGAALFDSLPVWENVAFGLMSTGGMSRRQAKKEAIERLADVGLEAKIANMNPASLSGGMKKRVGLARAIASRPDILFFDEPTTGLDPIMGDMINELIVDCVKELGASTLTITHDMESARKIGDIIAMLYQGKIIWSGSVADLDACDNEIVLQFIEGRTDGPLELDLKRA